MTIHSPIPAQDSLLSSSVQSDTMFTSSPNSMSFNDQDIDINDLFNFDLSSIDNPNQGDLLLFPDHPEAQPWNNNDILNFDLYSNGNHTTDNSKSNNNNNSSSNSSNEWGQNNMESYLMQ
ncbi:hypothetical protein RMCBS344292_10389 [Rhizopus microsporus]|nr:hypothetical protein RMCBS344292_10389 [Rhizopus microsporus]